MIPNKLDVLRKLHTPFLIDLLTTIGKKLEATDFNSLSFECWRIEHIVPKHLTFSETVLIRQELMQAGWGCVVNVHSATEDKVCVFLNVTS